MPKKSIGYYAVRKGWIPGIYNTWEECKKQIHKFPGVMYKKFYVKKEAEEYIKHEKINEKEYEIVYTDGACENNGYKDFARAGIGVYFGEKDNRNLSERLPGKQQTNNRAEIYAVIRALDICEDDKNLLVYTDSMYVINSYHNRTPKMNQDLVNRMNKLVRLRKGKTIFRHVKGHVGIAGNEKADELAELGLAKTSVPEFNFNVVKQKTIKEYFKK